jgi:hypothetical protein
VVQKGLELILRLTALRMLQLTSFHSPSRVRVPACAPSVVVNWCSIALHVWCCW